jgi:ribosome biogenesis GTPase / thiamine phosphate phosphatase
LELLFQLGWEPFFHQSLDIRELTDFRPARVVHEEKEIYRLAHDSGEQTATLSGRLRLEIEKSGESPAVGDWVLVDPVSGDDRTMIHRILTRKTVLVRESLDSNRRSGHGGRRQILAANVDIVFVVEAFTGTVNINRIERYVALARHGGAQPVILLSKADLIEQADDVVDDVQARMPGLDIIPISNRSGMGIDRVMETLDAGRTGVLLGPSGVGKSTLINRLMTKDIQAVGSVREGDAKGRHTTTSRRLFPLPHGGLVIDTPGLRAIGLTSDASAIKDTFFDVVIFAADCRYRNCRHESEPGCAVRRAVEEGRLDRQRYDHYLTLLKEAYQRELRADPEARKRAGRRMSRMISEVKHLEKRKFKR